MKKNDLQVPVAEVTFIINLLFENIYIIFPWDIKARLSAKYLSLGESDVIFVDLSVMY